jgi:LysR family transcriptional regulator for metE and metH
MCGYLRARRPSRRPAAATELPRWLAEEYASRLGIAPVQLGSKGIAKQIYFGVREADRRLDYVKGFVALARTGKARSRSERAKA